MKYLGLIITLLLFSVNSYSQDIDYLPELTTGQVVGHNPYTLSYDEHHEQAEWVAYELTASIRFYIQFPPHQFPSFLGQPVKIIHHLINLPTRTLL